MSRKPDKPPTLSEYWNPPFHRNILTEAGAPVACLATTFEFEARFFETQLLPRFLQLRYYEEGSLVRGSPSIEYENLLASTPVAVLVDATRLDPSRSTLRWDQVPVEVPGGVQHSKIAILAWEKAIRLLVGSANLTRNGYKRNREIFAALDFFDDSGSAPKHVLTDALDFLEVILGWTRAPEKTRKRLERIISDIRSQLRGWKKAPTEGPQKGFPRVYFVPGHPATEKLQARSSLKKLKEIAGPQKVRELVVMTPFVTSGQTEGNPVLDSLLERAHIGRYTVGWLIAPEKDSGDRGRKGLALPRTFGDDWKKRFGRNARVLAVPPSDAEGYRRELHAKAILLERAKSDLLMIGSSNFTAHGMGVGAWNCEANLIFLDKSKEERENLLLYERLVNDIDWQQFVHPDKCEWSIFGDEQEDSESAARIPQFFRWATVSRRGRCLTVELDRQCPEPDEWTIRFADIPVARPVFSKTMSTGTRRQLCCEIGNRCPPSSLLVRWRDRSEGRWQEGLMAVCVEDPVEDLPPLIAVPDLPWNRRLEYLAAGQNSGSWLDTLQDQGLKQTQAGKAINALAAVDTTDYLLYRARHYGGALTRLAEKITATPCIPAKIRACLLQDPFGPVQIAKAIGEECRTNPDVSGTEYAFRLFMLAEILLLLKCARDAIQKQACSKATANEIRTLFDRACHIVNDELQTVESNDAFTREGKYAHLLACYIREVRRWKQRAQK